MFTLFKDRLKDLYWNVDNHGGRIVLERNKKPFRDETANFADKRVNEVFQRDNELWNHEEIIAEVDNVLVEPEFAYAIRGYRTIIGLSRKKGRFGIPSPIPVIKAQLSKPQVTIEKAVLLDGSLGNNYFYFHAVLLSKIHLLREYYDLTKLPVLVAERTFNKSYFQQLITLPEFSNLNWKVVSDVTHVQNLIICVPSYYEKSRFQKTRKLILGSETVEPRTKRIFIDRSNRRISNYDTVKLILEKYEFTTINPGEISLIEQAKLFNEASHIIGIHGAGLTNLIFCEAENTKVLEIAPSVLLHTHYYWLCLTMGMNYDIVVGEATRGVYDDFEVDVNLLEKKILQLLSN